MYGSQFYFHELDDVFRNACYAYHDKKDKYVKMREAFLFRYVVFLGVTYVTLFDTDHTTTHTPFDSCSKYKNVDWCAEGFNSAYHGKYSGDRSLDPVFCVCDNERIVLLSHYAIDMDTVPETPPILSTSITTDAQYVIL